MRKNQWGRREVGARDGESKIRGKVRGNRRNR